MNYIGLTDAQIMHLAETLPERPDVVKFHEYVQSVRDEVDGNTAINIPESHRKIFSGENREGAHRLNKRINQLAAYLSRAEMRFSVIAASDDTDVQANATALGRFIRNGEQQLARGRGLINWKHATYRDAAECGVSIIQQMPLRGYYVQVKKNPKKMADGALINEVVWRRRVDPVTFCWDVRSDGSLGNVVLKTERMASEILETMGDVALATLSDLMSEALDPTDPDRLATKSFKLREVWWDDGWAVVLNSYSGSKNFRMKASLKKDDPARIIARGQNFNGRPPFYLAAATPAPWASPLDEMFALTGTRNYWATMLDIQASGAIFRHWQLVDSNTQEDITFSHPEASRLPEAVRYDPSQPPPDMGPGTEWKLAPFEFHDVTPRYEQIRQAHENAGSAAARLMGEPINQNTPVGTADALDDSAQREFTTLIQSIEDRTVAMWADELRWHRTQHKDPIQVFDMQQRANDQFVNTISSLSGDQIETEHLQVRLDTRSRLALIADYRMYVEMEMHGHMDFDRGVNEGLVPFVTDAEAEKNALFVSELERLESHQRLQQLSGAQTTDPRFLAGRTTDRRGSGVGQGPDNVANTALDAGGADAARAVA